MTESDRQRPPGSRQIMFRVGREEVVVRRWYEVASIVNDLMIGIWFVVGSILFFSPTTDRAGTWMFLIGSIQLTIRPAIRLGRDIHLRRVGTTPGGELLGSGHDF